MDDATAITNANVDTAPPTPAPQNPASPPVEPPKTPKTYSEEDYQKMSSGQYAAGLAAAMKEAGFEPTKGEDFKKQMKAFRTWSEAQKTEQQKAADALADVANKDAENADLRAQLAAATLGVKPDSIADVVALAKTRTSDGVDIQTAMKQVLDAYPHFKADTTPPPIPGAPNPGGTPDPNTWNPSGASVAPGRTLNPMFKKG